MLPKEFPKWCNCYDYFKKWSEKPNGSKKSVLERVLKKIVGISKMNVRTAVRPALPYIIGNYIIRCKSCIIHLT
ncbi:hypothetical protein [Wolbachia endosymbiont (group A) of Longitarsus flavicornis]